ncbi:MAG: phosphoribosylformylglycinamidine synthase subunit PurS [Bacteroidia bacterium]|nr:phosphoribosylformylglycinamidine synthase subunit PurS [Bacteroidia bacterium]
MKFLAKINIMPREELLDPQGKATILGLNNLGFQGVENLRVGKRIHLQLEAASSDEASAKVQEACNKLLHNPIMEVFEFELVGLN